MNSIKVLIEAEKIVLNPNSTPEQLQQAIDMVASTGDESAVMALKQTIRYEQTHRASTTQAKAQ